MYPKREIVENIVKKIISKEGVVRSQTQLERLVKKELGKEYKISGKRIRRIAWGMGIKVYVKFRKGKNPNNCPLCRRELSDLKNLDLFGKEVVVGKKCNCGFKIYKNKNISNYEFLG